VYLPVQVPEGVAQIDVSYTYSKLAVPPGTLSNSCYIGIFDQRGIRLNGRGFRGWSGGFRTTFSIAADSATPGHLPGPVRPGTWHIVLGPHQISPVGLDYGVTVTLTFGPNHVPVALTAASGRRSAGLGEYPTRSRTTNPIRSTADTGPGRAGPPSRPSQAPIRPAAPLRPGRSPWPDIGLFTDEGVVGVGAALPG